MMSKCAKFVHSLVVVYTYMNFFKNLLLERSVPNLDEESLSVVNRKKKINKIEIELDEIKNILKKCKNSQKSLTRSGATHSREIGRDSLLLKFTLVRTSLYLQILIQWAI